MSKPIYQLVDDLPKGGLTVAALKSLDFVIPGQWNNPVGFDTTIRLVTGATDAALIQQIGERAVTLYNDRSQGYQQALWLYETVDSASGLLGTAAIANYIGQDTFLGFLKHITPKPETAQSLDLGVKLVAEQVAFCQMNGLPGDRTSDFLAALKDYGGESLMRMTALVCFDGVIPFGAGFTDTVLSTLNKTQPADLRRNQTFRGVDDLIPGSTDANKLDLIKHSFKATQDWMNEFVASRNLTQTGLIQSLSKFVDVSADQLNYLGAFLDVSVKYYRHTGIQTLARRLVERAAAEIEAETSSALKK